MRTGGYNGSMKETPTTTAPLDLQFVDPDGNAVSLASYRGKPLLLIYTRHMLCIACRAHLVEAATLKTYLASRGVEVLAVSFTPPALMKQVLAETPQPFRMVSDPERTGYKLLGMSRTRYLSFLRPRVLMKFIRQRRSGIEAKRPVDSDVLQLGGDFLLDAEGKVVWAWPSRDAQDRPSPAEIREAIQQFLT